MALAQPYRTIFISAGALAIVLAPLATLRPYLVKVMVDDYIFKYDIPGLTRMAFVFLGVLFLHATLQYFFIFTPRVSGVKCQGLGVNKTTLPMT